MLLIGTDFSGIGSPEEALRMARIKYHSVFACEKDPFARTTFEANNETEHFYQDITTRNQAETPEVDLYVAGFPCQAFSLAGKQLGFEDVRGTLFFNSADYIRIKRPKVFILENVKGLLSHDKVDKKSKYGRTFNTIINLLARTVNGQEQLPFYQDNLGYNVYHAVLNTKEHGIPQNRERIFIVGIRPDIDNNTFRFPSKEPLLLRLKDILEKEVDEHYYLSDKMLEYLFGRSKNFNSGKINFKGSEDIASAITSASASLDVSDNILVTNSHGQLTTSEIANCLDSNYHKGIDNHGQRSMVLENDVLICKPTRTEEGKAHRREAMRNGKDHTPFQAKELRFEASDVMNTVTCATQKDNLIAVVDPEVRCCAMRGRGEGWQQELEVRPDEVTNTLTAVQKDNLILIGNVSDKDHQATRVYNPEGVSCTIQSEGGGQGAKTGLYLVENSQTPIIVPNNTQKGYSEAKEGDSINMKYLKSKTAGSMVKEGIASTLDHNCNQAVVVQTPEIWDLFGNTEKQINVGDCITHYAISPTLKAESHGHPPMTMATNYRIRKLTPLECFRLQGFSDAFYYQSKAESEERSKELLAKNPNHKGKRQFSFGERIERMSDSQLYKQAGNSITTRVIMKVILNLKGILNFEYEND